MSVNRLLSDTNKWLSAMESDNTKENYERHIDDFCKFLFNMPLREINKNTLINADINFETMLRYKNFLSEKYAGQTVRTKYFAIKSWLNYLHKLQNYNIAAPDKLKLDKKTMPKVKGNNGSKPFTHNEILEMISKAKEYSNGEMKSLLIELAYVTAWRKEALLTNLRYGSIYRVKDNSSYWLVDIVDKGEKEDTKAISNDLYERIMKLKPHHSDGDLIFPISDTSADNIISQLKIDLKIQGDKTFHGIKKASVNRVLDLTDNLFKAKDHACHESIETTAKFYAQYHKDYDTSMSLHIMDNLDENIFDNLSKEELLDLIKNSEDKIKFALLLQMKNKKIKKREELL